MDCCGYDRVTPFCPMCGKTIASEPIMELLRHVQRTARERRGMEKNSIRIYGGDESSGYQKNLKRIANKWEKWYEALNKLIKKNAKSQKE